MLKFCLIASLSAFVAVGAASISSTRSVRAIGESCSPKDPNSKCPRFSSCFALNCADSVCICNEGFWPSKDFTECLPAVALGGTCTPSGSSCMARPPNSMTCKNSQCACSDGYAPTDDGQRCGQYFAGFGMSVVKMSRLNDTCDNKTRKCAHGLECRPFARNSPISTCQCAAGFRPRTRLEDRVRFNTIEDCLSITYSIGCPTTSTTSTTPSTTASSTTTTTVTTTTTSTTSPSTRTTTTARTTTTPPPTTTTTRSTPRSTLSTTVFQQPVVTTEDAVTFTRTTSTTTKIPARVEAVPTTTTTSMAPSTIETTTTATMAPETTASSTTTTATSTTSSATTTSTLSTTTTTRRTTTTTNLLDSVTLDTVRVTREQLTLPIDLIVPAAVVAVCCLLAGVLGVACACVRRSSHFVGKKSGGTGTLSAVATNIGSGASSEVDGSQTGGGRNQGWSPDRNMMSPTNDEMLSPNTAEDIMIGNEPPNTSRAAVIFNNNFGPVVSNSPAAFTEASNDNVVPGLVPPLPSRHYSQQTYIANAAATIAATRNSHSGDANQSMPPPPPPPLPARPLYGTIQRSSHQSTNSASNGSSFGTASRPQRRVSSSNSPPFSIGQQSQQQILVTHQQLRMMRSNINR